MGMLQYPVLLQLPDTALSPSIPPGLSVWGCSHNPMILPNGWNKNSEGQCGMLSGESIHGRLE